MAMGGAHVDIFSAAEKLRSDASIKSRMADFSLRIFFALALIGGGLLSLVAMMVGTGALIDFIVTHISIIPR